MEEVATCTCKNQAWIIYNDKLECTVCHKVYPYGISLVHAVNYATTDKA